VAHQTSAKSSSLIFIINSSGIPLRHPSATPTDKLCYAFTGRQTLCMRRWQTDMSLYVGCVRAARLASMTVRTNTSASVFVCVSRPARGHEAYCTRGPTRTRMQFVPLRVRSTLTGLCAVIHRNVSTHGSGNCLLSRQCIHFVVTCKLTHNE